MNANWKDAPVVIHIGLPKCASTTMQRFVFNQHPDIQFLGIYRPVYEWDAETDYMVNAPAYDYLTVLKGTETLAFSQERLDGLLPAPEPGKIAVLSDEDLSFPDKVDRVTKAQRLKASFPNAVILVTIRNPVEWVESWYLFEMRKLTKYVPFDDWMDRHWRKLEKSILRVLRYRALVQCYAELFGKNNVRITTLEDLRRDQPAFIRRICAEVGVDPARLPESAKSSAENVRMPSLMLRVARTFPAVYNARGAVPPKMRKRIRELLLRTSGKADVSMPNKWRREIAAFCARDLQWLDSEWDLGLRERGYPMDPADTHLTPAKDPI
jgi:hypothetical protein